MSEIGKTRAKYGEGVTKMFRLYWRAYGGWHELVRSPYLHISLLLSSILYPLWTSPKWWDIVISVVPGMIGFALGGYAILLAFGNDQFRSLLSGKGKPESTQVSPFIQVNAAFVHFILMQIGALVVGLIYKAFSPESSDDYGICASLASLPGFALFVYSIACAVAATFAILRIANWYNVFTDKISEDTAPAEQEQE